MAWLVTLLGHLAPIFVIMSPLLSYSDQAYSMYRQRSSAGFSLDIPFIMLTASLCKIFYWPGARFDNGLLLQAIFMIVMQCIILKIALDYRPAPSLKPFAGLRGRLDGGRPFRFWQWQAPQPYWQTILYIFIVLTLSELVFAPLPPIYAIYSPLVGYVGLAVEALLPIPQIMANWRARSCKGFRPSVLVNWVIGDAMKILWFFTAATAIPWPFKLCALFQSACDVYLGYQFFKYGSNSSSYHGGDFAMASLPKPEGNRD